MRQLSKLRERSDRLLPVNRPLSGISQKLDSEQNTVFGGPAMRRFNVRLRLLFMLAILIFLCLLLGNVLFARHERRRSFETADNVDIQALIFGNHEDHSIDRLQQKGPRRPIVNFPHKIVHLDLKGAPLNVQYLESIMPLLRNLGATGFLIEYEDMFPYKGSIERLSAKNAYTESDVKRLLRAAKSNNLIVIPLVQTFGHLEFALKLKENKHLREEMTNPQAVCPSRNGTVQMVKEMLRQVVALHEGYITHLHIGCDEVYAIGICDICQERMANKQWSKNELLLDHVTMVVQSVHDLKVQPILWDDMFRSIEKESLRQSPLVKLVEIMVWSYGKNIDLQWTIEKYISAGFSGLWVASAFKGSTSPTQQIPEFRDHLYNHHAWVELLKEFGDKSLNLKGIAITGWQRYDHFASLCEVFPVALPVLGACLAFLDNGRIDDEVMSELKKKLLCPVIPMEGSRWDMDSGRLMPFSVSCNYPSGNVSLDIDDYSELLKMKEQLMQTNYYLGWFSNMNKEKCFSPPGYVETAIRQVPDMLALTQRLETNVMQDFPAFTDKATAREWLATFIHPIRDWLLSLEKDATLLSKKEDWERRPLYDNN